MPVDFPMIAFVDNRMKYGGALWILNNQKHSEAGKCDSRGQVKVEPHRLRGIDRSADGAVYNKGGDRNFPAVGYSVLRTLGQATVIHSDAVLQTTGYAQASRLDVQATIAQGLNCRHVVTDED